jgi:S-formylglutathione hydrolase FrmB
MKKLIVLFTLLASITITYSQTTGKVLEGKTVVSKIMGKSIAYSIYLPPDYDLSSGRRYPVVYLFHGYSDSETAWVQFGNVNQAADKAIATNDITPMIIVMPQGELYWYANDFQGKANWMDMFIKEMIPSIDKEYRTRANRDYRAISGLSMGGYGSLINSLKNTNTFSACAALSAGVFTDDEMVTRDKDYENPWYAKGTKGKDRLTPYWYSHSIIEQFKTLPIDTLKKVRWYIDCGDGDFLAVGNAMMHITLSQRGVDHEYRVHDGYHNWDYWRTNITEALKFISRGFDKR